MMSTKTQIQTTLNALGNKMKGYTITQYVKGQPVGRDQWVTLQVLLGMTDFSDTEIDALADLQVDGQPLMIDFKEGEDLATANYIMIKRIH